MLRVYCSEVYDGLGQIIAASGGSVQKLTTLNNGNQELNELCRKNTAQVRMRQRRKYDEKILQAKPYAGGKYVFVFKNVIPPKGT